MEKLADRIRRRREIFENLDYMLGRIRMVVADLDPHADVYLFGSAASRQNETPGDVDVLIVSDLRPEKVIAHLWKMGFSDPFEFHVRTGDQAKPYFRRDNPLKIQ